MWGVGLFLWLFGAATFLIAALVADPSIDGVVNLDLQQRQLMFALAGLAMFVVGALMQTIGSAVRSVLAHPAVRPQASLNPIPEPVAPEAILSDEEQMRLWGISTNGERYALGEYHYDRLADAVAYAKLQKAKDN